MKRRRFSLVAFTPTRRCHRLSVTLCTLLILWAGIDSQVLLLISSPNAPASSSQEDNDDDEYLLDMTGTLAPSGSMRRNAHPPTPMPHWQIAVTKQFSFQSCHLQPPPIVPVCEQHYRNGIGTPLLC
jgi:hypothetical protein